MFSCKEEMMREDTGKAILISGGIVFTLVFSLFPFIYMVLVSLCSKPDFLHQNSPLTFTLQNYLDICTARSLHFLHYLGNSLLISLVSAFLAVLIASLAAYSLTRLNLPAKAGMMFLILAVSLFPQISLVGYLFKFMARLNWINTYQALLFPYMAWTLPLSVWILTSYFAQIPRELDKAALIDGCSRWQILRKIVFPVARPGLFSVFLLSFIFAFNEFMFALMLTTDFRARTIPVGIALFEGLHGQIPWGNIMAASVVATLPVIILTVIFQRNIIGGLTRGAIKG
jgi:multiple sugar transport system permease protein